MPNCKSSLEKIFVYEFSESNTKKLNWLEIILKNDCKKITKEYDYVEASKKINSMKEIFYFLKRV